MNPAAVDGGALASLIRRQVGALAKPGPSRGARRHEAAREPAGQPGAAADLGTVVARRVRALDPADPDRPRKAVRIFLESVLLAQFGERLVNDAGFHQLVDDVQRQMAGDSALARDMAAAAERMPAG